jgi:predicted esterase
LPAWRADLAHLSACLLAADGRPAEALAELRAAYAEGAWWHRRILLDDDDLAVLRDEPEFTDLARRSHARALAAGAHPLPPLVHRPAGPPRGLLVALHGAGEDPGDRRLPVVAAGFSAGGRRAMHWAVAGAPGGPLGFVAMAPAIRPSHIDAPLVASAAARGRTGMVIVGEDDDVREDAVATARQLQRPGVACRLEVVTGLGHAFSAGFSGELPAYLDAVAQPSI